MENVLLRTEGERAAGVAPVKAFPGLVKAVEVKPRVGSIKAARENMRYGGVIGKVEGYKPMDKEVDYVTLRCGLCVTLRHGCLLSPRADKTLIVDILMCIHNHDC